MKSPLDIQIHGPGEYVALVLPGAVFSEKSQALRDQIEEWIEANSLTLVEDVDFVYYLEHFSVGMSVWFRDPQKAMLFKLVFG